MQLNVKRRSVEEKMVMMFCIDDIGDGISLSDMDFGIENSLVLL